MRYLVSQIWRNMESRLSLSWSQIFAMAYLVWSQTVAFALFHLLKYVKMWALVEQKWDLWADSEYDPLQNHQHYPRSPSGLWKGWSTATAPLLASVHLPFLNSRAPEASSMSKGGALRGAHGIPAPPHPVRWDSWESPCFHSGGPGHPVPRTLQLWCGRQGCQRVRTTGHQVCWCVGVWVAVGRERQRQGPWGGMGASVGCRENPPSPAVCWQLSGFWDEEAALVPRAAAGLPALRKGGFLILVVALVVLLRSHQVPLHLKVGKLQIAVQLWAWLSFVSKICKRSKVLFVNFDSFLLCAF